MKQILSELNERQLEAVTTTEGPVLVLAGAGSGKTRVITVRTAYLIHENKAKPQNILAITFTNKAAEGMRKRILELIADQNLKSNPVILTFHAFCAKVLRREISKLDEGYTTEFTIFNADDSLKLITNSFKTLEIDEKKLNPKTVQSLISGAKNLGISVEKYLIDRSNLISQTHEILKVSEIYHKNLKTANALDFDDLLLKTVQLFKSDASIREKYSDFFRYIMVDEYQDTSPMQFELVKLLTSTHENICVVGDDNQSIYAFRHADLRNILDFEKHYPRAKVIKLEQNYRSTKNILSLAEEVIKNNKNRKPKRLWTENEEGEKVYYFNALNEEDEARFVATRIKEILLKDPDQKIAVLYRTNAQSRLFEEALKKEGLKYRLVGALSFYQRAEIKDIIAYLKVILNPFDNISLERIINVPPRRISNNTLKELNRIANERGITIWEAISIVTGQKSTLQKRNIKALKSFKDLIELLQKESAELQKSSSPVSETVNLVMKKTGYEEMLIHSSNSEDLARLENLEELLNAATSYDKKQNGLKEFIDNASFNSTADDYEESEKIILMTVHAAKGLEFPVVFLVSMEEGIFPHLRSSNEESQIEEERRLCYVAITRAMKTLYITHAKERRIYRRVKAEPSRFLKEMPPKLLEDLSETPSWLSNQNTPQKENQKLYINKTTDSKTDTNYEKKIYLGDYVLHKKYGCGIVLREEGEGEDAKLVINFPGFGQKKILARFVEKV